MDKTITTLKKILAWAIATPFIVITFSLYWIGYIPYYAAIAIWTLNDKLCLLSKNILSRLNMSPVFAKKRHK